MAIPAGGNNVVERAGFVEPDPDFLATVGNPDAPFGMEFNGGLINAQPAEEFPAQVSTDLDGLLFLGYLTDEFTLYGHKFTIRTMRRGEKLVVAKLVQEFETTIGLGDAISAATVAGCLMMVDSRAVGIPLSNHEADNPETWIRRNYAVVQKWYDPIIDGIYMSYQALLQRQVQAFLEFSGK